MTLRATYHLGPPPVGAELDHASILFVGTATTVLRLGAFTLLTDPNFLHAGDPVHLRYGVFSRRRTNPALEIDQLPLLDACLLSHLHGDHWDRVATRHLSRELPVFAPPAAARALRRRGFRQAVSLGTWDHAELRRGERWLRVTALPGRHGPGAVARLLPAVMGSMVELGEGTAAPRLRLYVSGDTVVHDELRRIPEAFPDVDVGLFHLGGTRVLGLLVTLDAEQGVEAVRTIRPHVAIPIHFDDYDAFRSPLEDFLRAADGAGLASRVHVLTRGETFELELPPARRPELSEPSRPAAPPPAAAEVQPWSG